jgi:hypothetical protein
MRALTLFARFDHILHSYDPSAIKLNFNFTNLDFIIYTYLAFQTLRTIDFWKNKVGKVIFFKLWTHGNLS